MCNLVEKLLVSNQPQYKYQVVWQLAGAAKNGAVAGIVNCAAKSSPYKLYTCTLLWCFNTVGMRSSQWVVRKMMHSNVLRILYLGRDVEVSGCLQRLFEQKNRITQSTDTLDRCVEFAVTSSQKTALKIVRAHPPAILLVEVQPKAEKSKVEKPKTDNRTRFCETVRYRLPSVTILAVSSNKPEDGIRFDGMIKLPIVEHQAIEIVQAVLERHNNHQLQCGPILLNLAKRTVVTPKGQYPMTPKQCALLKFLMTRQGQLVRRSEIMQEVWETSFLEDTRTLDVHIRWLRERIEPDPSSPAYLTTVRGVGYRFQPQG